MQKLLTAAIVLLASGMALIACRPIAANELSGATYHGIEQDPVTLTDGIWEGEPYMEGAASRPRVGLADGFELRGDLNGDGRAETVVLLWQSSGGSGTFDYLAVMEYRNGEPENIATAPIGDRVKIRNARISDGVIELDVTQQGPGDAACCPTHQLARSWSLEQGQLRER